MTRKELKACHTMKETRSRPSRVANVSQFAARTEFFGGASEKVRLEWVIDATWNKSKHAQDPKTWKDFQVSLAAFCGWAFNPLVTDLRDGKSELVTRDGADRLLERFRRIIHRAVKRQNIH